MPNPKVNQNPAQQRAKPDLVWTGLRRSIVRMVAVAYWIVSPVAVASSYIGSDRHMFYPGVWALGIAGSVGGALCWYVPWERFRPERFLPVVFSGIGMVTLGVFATGGIRSHVVLLYVIPIVVSTALYELRIAAVIVVVTALAAAIPLLTAWDGFYLRSFIVLLVVSGLCAYVPARARRAIVEEALSRERQLEHQALHDSLTGLPNRNLFHDRTELTIKLSRRTGGGAAVLIMDVNSFKEINDTLGHHTGDLVLQEIGRRLRGALRDSDTVARLGGDEFAVLLPTARDPAAASQVAQKLVLSLEQAFTVAAASLTVSASIGIAMYPQHGDTADELIQRADVAMYLAKASRSSWQIYAPQGDPYAPARLQLITELREALDGSSLLLHYQPKVDLRTGLVVGVEGLARWQHPRQGLLSPDRFIPLAEQTALIKPLTLHLLDTALAQLRAWQNAGLLLTVALNLSARNLVDLDLPDEIGQRLVRWQIEPRSLELEITESTIMVDPYRAQSVLKSLDAMGVELAIDDFGTGYSSLVSLRQLPIREIKIDKAFVIGMRQNDDDAAIVHSIIDLGRNLRLRVVAEGVETRETRDMLVQLGCDLAQGYYISRPVPGEALPRFIRAWNAGAVQPAA